MNAHTTIVAPRIESPHAAAISIHCANQNEWQMSNRIGIAEMRDAASIGARRAESDSACILLQEVTRLATFAVYADLPASRLIRIRSALSLTMEAARELERVQRECAA